MPKTNYGCTIIFKEELDIFAFYIMFGSCISSMTVSTSMPNQATFKMKPDGINIIKTFLKDNFKSLGSNRYVFLKSL